MMAFLLRPVVAAVVAAACLASWATPAAAQPARERYEAARELDGAVRASHRPGTRHGTGRASGGDRRRAAGHRPLRRAGPALSKQRLQRQRAVPGGRSGAAALHRVRPRRAPRAGGQVRRLAHARVSRQFSARRGPNGSALDRGRTRAASGASRSVAANAAGRPATGGRGGAAIDRAAAPARSTNAAVGAARRRRPTWPSRARGADAADDRACRSCPMSCGSRSRSTARCRSRTRRWSTRRARSSISKASPPRRRCSIPL